MRVEPATVDDLDRVVDLWVALADEQRHHGSHLEGATNREAMRMTLASHAVDGTLLVARDAAGTAVGFVNFAVERGALEETVTRGRVHNVYVEPGARDAGVGSDLLDAAEAALSEAGVDVVALEAMAANADARRLYRRRGYRPHRVEYERPAESDTHSRDDR